MFVGPQDLPKVARWLGRMVKRTRSFVREVKEASGWEQVLNEAKDVHATMKENDEAVRKAFDSVKRDVDEAGAEYSKNINEAKQGTFGGRKS